MNALTSLLVGIRPLRFAIAVGIVMALSSFSAPEECSGCVHNVQPMAPPPLGPVPPGCIATISISATLNSFPETCVPDGGDCEGDPCTGTWAFSWASTCDTEICWLVRGIPSASGVVICEDVVGGTASSASSSGDLPCGRTVSLQISIGLGAPALAFAYKGLEVTCSSCD
jgi:hypothetical protein